MTVRLFECACKLQQTKAIDNRWFEFGVSASKAVAVAVLAACLEGVPASAAITKDAASQQIAAQGTTSVSLNHLLGSGTNRLVVCGVQISNPTSAVTNYSPTVTF